MKFPSIMVLILLLVIISGCAGGESFDYPDIKDDFCGVHINYQYCKCAFHNDFCDAIGMSKSEANAHVNAEYDAWVDGLIEDFLAACVMGGGVTDDDTCYSCAEGEVAKNNQCVAAEDADSIEEDMDTVTTFVPDGPLDENCEIIDSEFNKDWRKYSDIDEVIPYNERSYEAKQAVDVYDQMIEKMIRAFELERDIEIEQQMQDELLEYKAALVQNIKTNLLKSFWRLSWVTYTTVKGGQGLGDSYSQVLTSGAGVETIGAGLKVVQGVIPGDSSLAIDTSTTAGKAASVGANTALEAIDSLGDPTKIATELFKSAANAPLPSADISPEEIEILRQQHIENGLLDAVIAQSVAENEKRQAELNQLEMDIPALQKQIDSWEAKEKQRVERSLIASCETLKKQAEESS